MSSQALRREDERPDVVMLSVDKDRINRFARLLTQRNETRSKLAGREKLLQLHNDATDEMILLDDDAPVQYNVGDAFFFDNKADTEARVEATQGTLGTEIDSLRGQIDEISAEIGKLKATLYAKFGKVRLCLFSFCFVIPLSICDSLTR